MKKNIIITLLITLVLWLSSAVIRLENFHYASFVGMCKEFKTDDLLQTVERHDCLHNTETRTNPLWHILYALQGE